MVIIFVLAFALTACGGNNEVEDPAPSPPIATPQPLPTPSPTPTPMPTPQSPPVGMAVSRLTGTYISLESAARRPFAVVYNNETRGMPQGGLLQADIIYEVIAEGSITRLVAIFQDFDAHMIGPIRSTRNYFTYFALDHAAIMVHHGGSPTGYNSIRNLGITAIDGMRYDGSTIWRDAERRQQRGLEHSSFTSAANLLEHAESRDFDMDAPQDIGMFAFFDEPKPAASSSANLANIVRVPHHTSNVSRFVFNPENNQYYKYIFDDPHMDFVADAQVSVTNVIVQITNISHIPGDEAGRRNVQMVGSGRGYLATHGSYSPITWVRESAETPTRWYDESGAPLRINRGRTWISVIQLEPTFE